MPILAFGLRYSVKDYKQVSYRDIPEYNATYAVFFCLAKLILVLSDLISRFGSMFEIAMF